MIAAGTRPLGRARARHRRRRGRPGSCAGDRACHLAENGLPRRPPAVVVTAAATGRAGRPAELLHAGADSVTVLAPDGLCCGTTARTRPYACATGATVTRRARAACASSASSWDGGEAVECDALVLAHGLVPAAQRRRRRAGRRADGVRTAAGRPGVGRRRRGGGPPRRRRPWIDPRGGTDEGAIADRRPAVHRRPACAAAATGIVVEGELGAWRSQIEVGPRGRADAGAGAARAAAVAAGAGLAADLVLRRR